MKDYERYMNRQRMSETGMARLMKLETERPEKGERAGKKREALPRWAKALGMAASLVVVVGLCALPILGRVAQWGQPAEEELLFHEVENVPFTDQAISGGMGMYAMEPGETAGIFGCAPDDFVGLLETVGLSKFDMEYYTFDMAHYPLGVVPQGDGSYRFLMKGNYISPREKPENWDEISEISWEMYLATSSYIPANTVWLEIYEGHSYLDEADWQGLEPQTFQGCQVTAACDEDNVRAAAAFNIESGGKTYGVLYSVTADGERNAKELVTQMVRYLTQSGLTIPGNEQVFNQVETAPPRVKTTGKYVMETEKTWASVPSVTFHEDGSFGVFVAYCSSHMCQGDYEIADGRVTVDCWQHHYVFDILDENTLRFVGAESSAPERYGEDDWPHITDGAVFRWEEQLVFNQVDDVPASMGDVVLGNQNKEMTIPEIAMILFSDEDHWDDLRETLGWTEYDVSGQSIPAGRDPETGWSINRFMLRGKDGQGNSFELDLQPNTTMFREEFDGLETSQVYGHTVTAVSGFDTASRLYHSAAAFEVADAPCDYGVYYAVAHADQETAEEMVTKLVNDLTGRGVFTEMYGLHGGEETTLEDTEPAGVFYLESAEGEALFYPYLNLSRDGNTFSWWRGTESSRSGSYAVADGKVRCHQSGQTYVFETVDEDTLRFVEAESDALDYLDADRVTRTLPDGAVLCRNDAQLGALDATHHPEPTHHVEVTHHPEPSHHSGHH